MIRPIFTASVEQEERADRGTHPPVQGERDYLVLAM